MGRKIARIAGIAKIARILLRSGFQFGNYLILAVMAINSRSVMA